MPFHVSFPVKGSHGFRNQRGVHAMRVRLTLMRRRLKPSKFVFAFGVEKLVGAVVIGFRHEDLGGTA